MHRPLLVAIVILLGLLALAATWFSRIHAAGGQVAELEPLPSSQAEVAATVRGPLQIPIASAAVGESALLAGELLAAQDRRQPVPLPAPPDYAVVYAQVPRDQLPKRFVQLEERIQVVRAACFDRLHANFDELYAAGEHGARVTEPGKAFENIEFRLDRPVRDYSARTVERPDGSFVMHVLEIAPAEEPELAELVAEREWVRGRIKGVH